MCISEEFKGNESIAEYWSYFSSFIKKSHYIIFMKNGETEVEIRKQ